MGRPPVCHQFLCDTLLRLQALADFRYAVGILSNLVNHVGKNACGRRHIVEQQDASALKQINFSRFEKQLNEAQNAFQQVRAFFDGHSARLYPSAALKKISRPPANYFC